MAQLLEKEVRKGEHAQELQSTGSKFRRLNPPIFYESVDLVAADQWLRTMERMIKAA